VTTDGFRNHDMNPFEALKLPEPERPTSLLKRVLPHVVMLMGLFVALVVGVISGCVSCLGVVVFGDALLPLGALLGMVVTAVVVVSIYRWSVQVSDSLRNNG
jgi:hypothetical protein